MVIDKTVLSAVRNLRHDSKASLRISVHIEIANHIFLEIADQWIHTVRNGTINLLGTIECIPRAWITETTSFLH